MGQARPPEWYRHLAELGIPPNRQMPRDLWTWVVDVEVGDLADEARLERVGLEPPRPAHRVLALFRRGGSVAGAQAVTPTERVDAPPAPPTGMVT